MYSSSFRIPFANRHFINYDYENDQTWKKDWATFDDLYGDSVVRNILEEYAWNKKSDDGEGNIEWGNTFQIHDYDTLA